MNFLLTMNKIHDQMDCMVVCLVPCSWVHAHTKIRFMSLFDLQIIMHFMSVWTDSEPLSQVSWPDFLHVFLFRSWIWSLLNVLLSYFALLPNSKGLQIARLFSVIGFNYTIRTHRIIHSQYKLTLNRLFHSVRMILTGLLTAHCS